MSFTVKFKDLMINKSSENREFISEDFCFNSNKKQFRACFLKLVNEWVLSKKNNKKS
jgi:hypothetical protein